MEDGAHVAIVRRAFAAFTRRDVEAFIALSARDVELVPVTARRVRPGAAYRGVNGVREYFADVSAAWLELRVIPQEFHTRDGLVLALGRVYARDLNGALVDSSAAWLCRIEDGRLAYGRVFERPEEALAAFDAAPA